MNFKKRKIWNPALSPSLHLQFALTFSFFCILELCNTLDNQINMYVSGSHIQLLWQIFTKPESTTVNNMYVFFCAVFIRFFFVFRRLSICLFIYLLYKNDIMHFWPRKFFRQTKRLTKTVLKFKSKETSLAFKATLLKKDLKYRFWWDFPLNTFSPFFPSLLLLFLNKNTIKQKTYSRSVIISLTWKKKSLYAWKKCP